MCPPFGFDETIMAYKMPLGGGIHRISSQLRNLDTEHAGQIGSNMREIAQPALFTEPFSTRNFGPLWWARRSRRICIWRDRAEFASINDLCLDFPCIC